MAEIQQADAHFRKIAILALLGILLGGGVLLIQFESWLADIRSMPVEVARKALTRVFGWSMGIGTVTTFLGGCYFWWWGSRVRCARRFPLSGATVLRDTVVLEGQAAASRGIVLQLLGGTIILCAVGLAVGSWWILRLLGTRHG